jgi:hypothetical protein
MFKKSYKVPIILDKILMKLEDSRHIFGKVLKYQISLKSVQWDLSCSMLTYRHAQVNSNFTPAFLMRLKIIIA